VSTTESLLVLFQYSNSGGRTQSAVMAGILIGMVSGMVARPYGRSSGRWAAFVGAVCFAIALAVNQPARVDFGLFRIQLPLQLPMVARVSLGTISGAVWCGIWGMLFSWINANWGTWGLLSVWINRKKGN
jgi:hypothetical protein